MPRSRLGRLTGRPATAAGILVLGAALVGPSSAFAQATRTWVSGTGDDANPCSRTAPCKTWAGAITKTAVGGTIDAQDPGGFGAITITKSITLDGTGTNASILVSGTNGVIVNAPGAKVILRDLDVEGIGAGLNGIQVVAVGSLQVDNLRIYGFTQNGIKFAPTVSPSRLVVNDTSISNNTGDGILDSQGTSGTGGNRVTLRNDKIDSNGANGVEVQGVAGGGFNAVVNSYNTAISDNGAAGVLSNGVSATVRISLDSISGNVTGLLATNSGKIISSGNNTISGNNTDGVPTSTVPLI
jgi:hypothetical protein